MIKKISCSCSILLLAWFGGPTAFGGAAVIIQPVSATGTHTIIGTDIFLPSGPQRVGFEIRVAGWDPRELKTAQARVHDSGFDNGSVSLSPAIVACPSNNSAGHNFCAQTLGPNSKCNLDCGITGCHCEWGFQSTLRSDYVAFGFGNISAADIATPRFRCGMTINDASNVLDPGVSLYLGTFYLDVPAGAEGIYAVEIDKADTFLRDGAPSPTDQIPIELHAGTRIIIGAPVAPGSRYVAFEPDEPGSQTAVRVILTSLYHPSPPVAPGEGRNFLALQGQTRWLGPPATFPDAAPGSSFVASRLQCTPHYANWGAFETVQVYGDAIVPSSVYTFQQCEPGVDPDNPVCSGPVQKNHTGQWGDVAAPFARSDQPAQPDVADIAAIIDSFRALVNAAPKARSHLRDVTPDPSKAISFIDVKLAVDAIRGEPFPYPVPPSCPP